MKHIYKILLLSLLLLIILYFLLRPSSNYFQSCYSTVIVDKNGELLGARIADDGQWRFTGEEKLPEKFKASILLFEDKHFYHHLGINFFSLVRSAWQNIKAKKIVSGGSTVTMQVIRLHRVNKRRTIIEKFIEMILASRLELYVSKDKILSYYSNHAPFGGNVVGLTAASWRYFGRPPQSLSWSESALLAVLPNSPAIIHPGKNRLILLKKRNRLLFKLLINRYISKETYKLSLLEPLPLKPLPLEDIAPQFIENIKLQYPGKTTMSTLDKSLQENSNRIIADYYNTLKYNEINNLCALIIDVKTGNILTYIGNIPSQNFSVDGQNVDCIKASRSTGSILKPLLYMAAQQEGLILPSTLLPDIPTRIGGFKPENYDMGYDGAVPAKRALTRSLNIPAVRLLQMYGIPKFEDLLKKLGMSTLVYSPDHYGLTLIVGGAEGKLTDLTNIYAGLAYKLNFFNQNSYYPSSFSGNEFYDKVLSSGIDAGAIWLTFEALLEVNRPEEEWGWENFASSRKIAWKTGTSYGYRDAWAIGTTPEYVVGVWVGNADGEGRPGLTGVSVAAPVMFRLFNLLPATSWFYKPYDDLEKISVCHQSGYKAGPYCDDKDSIYISKLGIKTSICPYHSLIHLDNSSTKRVNSKCYDTDKMKHMHWFILPPAMEYFYRKKNIFYKPLPPLMKECNDDENISSMELIYPADFLKIIVPKEIDGSSGKAVFEMADRDPGAILYWHVDNEFIGTTRNIHQIALSPGPGKHLLTVVDNKGKMLTRWFEVAGK
jgi:penicillin-binding protein 1C